MSDDGKAKEDVASAAYTVGPGRPPRDTRFKPGVSGNPKGRPKGTKNLATTLGRELRRRISVVENGRPYVRTAQEVILRRLTTDAMKGSPKAIDLALRLAGKYEPPDVETSAAENMSLDHEALRRIKERLERVISDAEEES